MRDGACFHMSAVSPGWNPVFSGRCVHARTVLCNIRIFTFFFLCLDVRVVVVSVIHGEQLHISLREKPSHENVGENDVKERAWVTAHLGENEAEAEHAARNAENYQGIPQVVLILVIYNWPVRVMWPQTSARISTWPTTVTQIFTYTSNIKKKIAKVWSMVHSGHVWNC